MFYHLEMLQYWTTVAIAVAGFSISIISLLYQIRRARFQQSIDLLFRLEGNFFGQEKRELRSKAARAIGKGNYSEVEPILDFFETIALLDEKGALDQYMVWHTFFYWINNYYQIASGHIAIKQRKDPNVWVDLQKLVARLRVQQKKSLSLPSVADAAPSEEEMKSFLLEEMQEAG